MTPPVTPCEIFKYGLAATPVLAAGVGVAAAPAPSTSAEGLRVLDFATVLVQPEQIDFQTWKSTASQWFLGINSVLGVQRTGIYGPGVIIDGTSVDVDDVLAPDFGQWGLVR